MKLNKTERRIRPSCQTFQRTLMESTWGKTESGICVRCHFDCNMQKRLKEGKHGNDALADPCSRLKEQ